jgi:hypothetical protein
VNRKGTDEDLLRSAGCPTDTAALLTFFRRRSPSAADQERFAALVRDLGGATFDVREKAAAGLVAAGPAAVPWLRRALTDPDRERVRRARECLAELATASDLALPEAAARLLARRGHAAALPMLLAYLPFADDDQAEQAVLDALADLHQARAKTDPAVLSALTDPEPSGRAAAAFLLGPAADPQQRRALGRLLAEWPRSASGRPRRWSGQATKPPSPC